MNNPKHKKTLSLNRPHTYDLFQWKELSDVKEHINENEAHIKRMVDPILRDTIQACFHAYGVNPYESNTQKHVSSIQVTVIDDMMRALHQSLGEKLIEGMSQYDDIKIP